MRLHRRNSATCLGHVGNASNAFTLLHVLKALVDVVQVGSVSNVVVDLESAVQVPLDNTGQFGPALDTAERRTLPLATGNELEGTSCDLLTGSSDTDDRADTPTLVASLQSASHDPDVAGAVKGVVQTSIGDLDEVRDNVLVTELGRVDEFGGAKLLGPGLLLVVGIDGNDATSACIDSTGDDGETDTANAEDGDGGALLDLGSVGSGTPAGGDTASKQTGLVTWRLGVDGDERVLRDDGELREGGAAHEVEELFTLAAEALGLVWHDTLTLGGTNGLAEVGLAGLAELALTALGSVEEDDRVALLDVVDALADGLDDTGAFVTENGGEGTFGIGTRESVGIRVAETGVGDLDTNLARTRRLNLDFFDRHGLAGLPGDGGLAFDGLSLGHCSIVGRVEDERGWKMDGGKEEKSWSERGERVCVFLCVTGCRVKKIALCLLHNDNDD